MDGWFAPGIGQVKEITDGGTENPAVYILADNVAYGTPPALAISDVSGMFDDDANLSTSGNGGTRWEKQIHNFVHNTSDNTLSGTRFRPNGAQDARTGTLNGSAFTMTGMSGTPADCRSPPPGSSPRMENISWAGGGYDAAPDVKYAFAGNIINAGPGRSTGDENISASTCDNKRLLPGDFHGPGDVQRVCQRLPERQHTPASIPGPPISESYWFWNDPEGSLLHDRSRRARSPPLLLMPSRFVLDNVYTTYDMGGGNTRKIKVDAVQSVTVPLGTYPLSLG